MANNVKNLPNNTENLQATLNRLRQKMVVLQDDFDVTSLAIRCIERDLEEIDNHDKEANNASNA